MLELLNNAAPDTDDTDFAGYWTKLDSDGRRMYARYSGVSGATLPVVLVHGLVVSGDYLLPLARLLGQSHLVLVPDLPGMGKSARLAPPLEVPALADALACWLRAQALGPVALIGDSFGAQVAAEVAAREPELVERLILIGPTMDRVGRNLPRQLARWIVHVALSSWRLRWLGMRDGLAAGLGFTLTQTRLALRDGLERKLPHITVPALVVCGARDPIAPTRWAEEVAASLPHGALAIIDGVCHSVTHDEPERMLDVLLAALR